MKKSAVLLYVAVFLFVGSYAVYNIYLAGLSNIDTQYAVLYEIGDTVSSDCFVIRDENHGDSDKNQSIIKNKGEGVYIPYVEDGSRVAAGDTIALFFKSEESAKAYREKQELEKTLAYYEKLQSQTILSMLDIDKLENTINENLLALSAYADADDYSSVTEILETLKYDITSKKIAIGEKADFSKQIKSIKSQIKKLSSLSGDAKAIKADFPGCFISSVDGYETAADYYKVSSLSCDDFDKLLSSEPKKVSSSAIGKIIDEYNWYAVCRLPKSSLEKIKIGDKVSVSFENTNVTDIAMKIYSVSQIVDGNAVVTFVSNEMNSDIALLRKERISIVTDKIEGLKIPKTAVRNAENPEDDSFTDISQGSKLGVYIVYGQVIKFRNINVIYYGNDYVIVSRETDKSDYLKLYDSVITKGRNLYDGKIIN